MISTAAVIIGGGLIVSWFYLIRSAKLKEWGHVAANVLILAGLYYGFTAELEYGEMREAVMSIRGN
jgi:hypothetical protein|tara:strand:+ start:412 stop:609 length:198 start_codon:yes stop_codon:yes gene_type:complete